MNNRIRSAKIIAVSVFLAIAAIYGAAAQGGDNEGHSDSRIKRGFEIAPVPLNLEGKNRALVGLGSYIVNAVGDCSACHTNRLPEFVAGGNPFLGQPEQIDVERYLIGGRQFMGGTIRSRNLTPDPATGLPAGYTSEQFLQVMTTGEDLKKLPPHVPSFEHDLLQSPMPWPVFHKMTERDILAVYEYLRSIPSRPGFPRP